MCVCVCVFYTGRIFFSQLLNATTEGICVVSVGEDVSVFVFAVRGSYVTLSGA